MNAPKTPCIHASPLLCTRYNIRLHCDSAIIGTAGSAVVVAVVAASFEFANCVMSWPLTIARVAGEEVASRHLLNPDRVYRALASRAFVFINDAAPTNCSYVLRYIRRVLTLPRDVKQGSLVARFRRDLFGAQRISRRLNGSTPTFDDDQLSWRSRDDSAKPPRGHASRDNGLQRDGSFCICLHSGERS